MFERLKQISAKGWFSPAVHCHCAAEWQLLPRWGGWQSGGRETPSVTTVPSPHQEGMVGGGKAWGSIVKWWLQATRWEGRRRREERLAVCMSRAVLRHQPPSIKEPLEGPRTVAAQEGVEERGCVWRKRHYSCPQCPQRSISGERIGSKSSGWMMELKFSRSDWLRAISAARGPCGLVTCTLTPWVKLRQGGGDKECIQNI